VIAQLDAAVRRRKAHVQFAWTPDSGWTTTEQRVADAFTVWPPHPTLADAVTAYLRTTEAA